MAWQSFIQGLRRLGRPGDADADLNDEVAQFIDASAREHMRRGLPRAAAERAARLEFVGVEAAKEDVRTSGWDGAIASFVRDIALGARAIRRNPTFAAVTCLTLALGIGANTAMFTVIDAVILRPLPYRQPSSLVL